MTHTPTPVEPRHDRRLAALSLGALGVVFGDIGTSPLYAFKEAFSGEHALPLSEANVFGVLSMIFWAVMLISASTSLRRSSGFSPCGKPLYFNI